MNASTPVLAFVWSGELSAQAVDEMFGRQRVSRSKARTQVAAFVAARGPQPSAQGRDTGR